MSRRWSLAALLLPFLLLSHNPIHGSKINHVQEEFLEIHAGNQESNSIGSINFPYFQTGLLGSLLKLLANIIEPLFKLIGDLIVGIVNFLSVVLKALFDGLCWVVVKIFSGLSWIFHQIVDFFDVIFKFFSSIFSEVSTVRSVLDAPDGTYSHSFASEDSLSGEFLEDINSNLQASFGVFSSMPTGADDYHKIFPSSAGNPEAIKEFKKVKAKINNLKSLYRDSVENTVSGVSAIDFSKYLSSVESDYVAIIGHNMDGSFVFLNPPPIDLSKMAAMCVAAKKKCIFLSCESSSYIDEGIAGAITVKPSISYEDAYKVIDSVIQFSLNSRDVSLAEIENVVQRTLIVAKYKPVVEFVVVTSSSVSGLAGIVISLEEEKAPNKLN